MRLYHFLIAGFLIAVPAGARAQSLLDRGKSLEKSAADDQHQVERHGEELKTDGKRLEDRGAALQKKGDDLKRQGADLEKKGDQTVAKSRDTLDAAGRKKDRAVVKTRATYRRGKVESKKTINRF